MVKAIAGIVALLIVGSLLWIGSEMHYRNCIDAAKARTSADTVSTNPYDQLYAGRKPTGESRPKAIKGCSRLP